MNADSRTLSIGELSERTGVASSALRYYEEIGLLQPVHRSGGRRRYDHDAVATVGVVLFLRDVGFSLTEVAQLRDSRSEGPNGWHALARRKLSDLDAEIADRQAAREALVHSLECPQADIAACPRFWEVVGQRLAARTAGKVALSEPARAPLDDRDLAPYPEPVPE